MNLTTPTASNVSKSDWKADLMASESATYCFQAMVRGWVAAVGEELSCVRETDNHRRASSSSRCFFNVNEPSENTTGGTDIKQKS